MARRSMALTAALLLAAAVAVGGALLDGAAGAAAPAADAAPATGRPADAPPAQPAPPATMPRQAARLGPEPSTDATPTDALDFASAVTRLVDLGMQMSTAVRQDDLPRAHALNDAARALLGRLIAEFGDAPEQALGALGALADGGSGDPRRTARFQVLLQIVRAGLADRHERSRDAAARQRLDALLRGCLASLVLSAELARELGSATLVDAPFLGPAQEAEVLALFDLLPDAPFLGDVAGDLLRTLWHNLERSGARRSDEIAALALLYADDPEPARRAAALEHLLTAAGGRYRDDALRRALDRRDPELLRALAHHAGRVLPPPAAIRTLARLGRADPVAALPGFVALGPRGGEALLEAYATARHDPAAPELRAGLLAAAQQAEPALGARLALRALHGDPDPAVRQRALLALGSTATPSQLEDALETTLADTQRAADPQWLAHAVDALHNAADRCPAEVLERLGNRLAGCSGLRPPAALRLTALLDRARDD